MHILTRFSLKRASIIILMALFVIGAGVYSAFQLKSELLPNIDLPVVSVIVVYPGAAPDDVRRDVTEPVEKAIAGTANLKNVTSTSNDSVAFVSAEYEYGTNMEKTQQTVQDLVNRITFPTQVQRPTVGRFSFQDIPVVAYTINTQATGEDALADLRRDLEDKLVPELKSLAGVNSVSVVGGGNKEVRITYNLDQLNKYNLTASSVNGILQANNISFPTGEVVDNNQAIPVRVTYQFADVKSLESIVVLPSRNKASGGAGGAGGPPSAQPTAQTGPQSSATPEKLPPVTLGEVAQVALVNAGGESISRSNGKPSLSITIYKTQNANTVKVAAEVAAKMEKLNETVPGASKEVLFDQSTFINDSINGLIREGLLGALLAIIVILVFLASVKSTLVTAVSIPLSVLIALTMFNVFGITLNIMSLAGLAVAIGRVVDDSIVVLENIYRHHFQRGEPLRQAAFTGTKEVATAITSSTITTVCVFLPLGFIAGLVSEFFRPFAVAVTVSLLASLLVALTVIPVLAVFFLKTGRAKDPGPVVEHEEKETWIQRLYTPSISWALKNRANKLITLGLALLLFIGSMVLSTQIGTTFLSFGSDKVLQATVEMQPGTDLATTDKASQVLEAEIQKHPGVRNYQASAGTNTAGAASGFSSLGNNSTAKLTVTLEREADIKAEADWLRGVLSGKQTELKIANYSVSTGTGGGPNSSAYSMIVSGNNYDETLKASEAVLAKLKDIPNLVSVTSNAASAKPEIRVVVNPDKALEHGSTTVQIATQVRTLLTSQKVTQITIDSRTYDVQAVFDKATLNDLEAIKNIKVGTVNPVALREVADVSLADGPVSISRVNQERAITLSGTITSDSTSGVIVAAQKAVKELNLPATVKVKEGGVSQQQSESFTQLGVALVVAIMLVYIVMVLTFGSLTTPFIIMFSLPLAAIGSIVALWVTSRPLGISALIGVLMLVGIVVTNAIVLLDLVEQLKARGYSTQEALIRGGRTRVRPIIMTAIATIFALVPLVLGFSEGSIIASELGTVVVGGLLTSTLLTLIVVPVVYSLLDGLRRRFGGGRDLVQEEFEVSRNGVEKDFTSLTDEQELAGVR